MTMNSAWPGHLSDELRKALSLGANDIPEWIYRMRRLGFIDGYPPAYLKQAIDSNENTLLEFYLDDEEEASALFGNDNSKPIRQEKGDPKPPKINADKMIYYFGFNFNSRRLRDRESNFRVPEFKDFVEYHQLVLNDRFRNEQRLKKKDDQSKSSPRKRHHEKKNSNNNHRSKKQRMNAFVNLDCISFYAVDFVHFISDVDDEIEVIDIDVEACANDSNADKGENSNGSENKNDTNNNNNNDDDNAAKMESSPSKRRRPVK
ncbi:unnamed protein product, partial [Anisakis simplex]|uniref:PSP domain-containing protein n=1 Tax=Anisakis simplex TaxID=6269 RepID=A0A0M3J8S6_ANISI